MGHREKGTQEEEEDKWDLIVHVKESELYSKSNGKPIKHLTGIM